MDLVSFACKDGATDKTDLVLYVTQCASWDFLSEQRPCHNSHKYRVSLRYVLSHVELVLVLYWTFCYRVDTAYPSTYFLLAPLSGYHMKNTTQDLVGLLHLKYIEDIFLFEVTTKYISSTVLKTSEFSRVRSTSENFNVFNSQDDIYLVFTEKK